MARHHRRRPHRHTDSCDHDHDYDDRDDLDDDDFEDDDEDDEEDPFDTPLIPIRNETPKIGRNSPCPCGSGKKYKKCHINQNT